MTPDRPSPPDPTGAGSAAEFVASLVRLRQWAGEPSLSRLRSLGGQTVTADGATVDALPKSTVSNVLRRPDSLPRWDFVKAFVTACLRYGDHPAGLIPGELERWRAAREALAVSGGRPSPAMTAAAAAGPSSAVDVAVEVVEAPAEDGQAALDHDHAHDHAVELLVRRVAGEEDRARKGLLGGYSLAPVSYGPDTGDGKGEGAAPGDDLYSIGRFFGDLSPRRLLVVGEAGAGKTVLAIELVLQLLDPFLTPGGRPPDHHEPVPVRLNAARWTLGSRFEPWLAEQLVQDFGLASADALRLVRDRRVLPVLDGLDELDPEPSTGPPRRAIGLLAELNRYSDPSGRRPGAVVVTCRADRHAELRAARAGLDGATRIHLREMTLDQIGTYLHARWPDGHPCGAHRDAVLAALSGPSGAAVHAALATPWRLLLTVTAVESGADPAELLGADPDDDPRAAAARIARRLLDTYVPAATELAPRTAHGTPYDPGQVRAWLVALAEHLRWQAAHAAATGRPPPGLTAIDIVPHLVWPIGGRRLVRVLHCACCAVFAVIAMLAFWKGSAVDDPGGLRDGLTPEGGLTVALMAGWVGIATGLSLSPWPSAAGGRSGVPRRRRVVGGLLGGLAGAPAGALGGLAGLALTGGRVFGPGFAVAAGAAGGLVLGAVIGLTAAGRRGAERMTMSGAIRAEPVTLLGFGLCGAITGLPPLRLAGAGPVPLAAGAAGAFVLAFALGTVFKVATGGWSMDAELAHPREALRRNPAIGVAFGLTGGVAAFLVFVLNQDAVTSLACALVGGVAFGLAFGAVAWSRAMIGLAVAAARGLLPLRLWTFLDWACEARLLRVNGATYQFRHRELQDHLTPSGSTAVDGR
ncbi:NACHT domain-containing protein [Actinomadura rugatobispora]|uniref:NACHT domain-containing protein n=1 Tax=Actinomadura rugatobispora TaxID=1994 RepID=A0ABW1A176_9ACTN|nr:hypothetical protein GCM10010200_049800 [Actinomadura rugatobispora]